MYSSLQLRWAITAALAALTIGHAPLSAAPGPCERVLSRIGDRLVDATCTESADLTTANPATTPANNAIRHCPRSRLRPRPIATQLPPIRPIARQSPGLYRAFR